jgi:hypothetical protein
MQVLAAICGKTALRQIWQCIIGVLCASLRQPVGSISKYLVVRREKKVVVVIPGLQLRHVFKCYVIHQQKWLLGLVIIL